LKPEELAKLLKAVQSAGVVIPTDPHVFANVATELSSHGVQVEPDWYIAGGSGYVLVCAS
jgi:hypothetical protein